MITLTKSRTTSSLPVNQDSHTGITKNMSNIHNPSQIVELPVGVHTVERWPPDPRVEGDNRVDVRE